MAGPEEDSQGTKRIAIIAVSSCLLVAMVIAVTVGVSINDENGSDGSTTNGNKNAQISSSKKAIELICEPTEFKGTCQEQLEEEAGNKTDVKDLVRAAFKATMKHVSRAVENSTHLRELEKDPGTKSALDACKILLNYTVVELEKSFDLVERLDVTNVKRLLADLKIWLSATIANQQACLDGFKKTKSKSHAFRKMKMFLNITMQLSRNGLAIACELEDQLQHLEDAGVFTRRRLLQDDDDRLPVLGHSDWTSFREKNENRAWNRRRLLQDDDRLPVLGHSDWTSFREKNEAWNRRRLLQDDDGLPVLGHSDWTSFREKNEAWNRRRLLQDEDGLPVLGHSDWTSFREKNEAWNRRLLLEDIEQRMPQSARRLLSTDLKPDLVVAKDGSGDCKTLNEAKQKIPRRSTKPYVVYVKEGVYAENVEITSDITHLALVGDGKEKTRITGSISTGPDGNPTTYFTATFGIDGNNFVAKNIAFENTAGPLKAQAVAVRVQSEDSVFFNCSIDGYQDTLYAFTKRQFYRDCTISGTIDFVFGDASVIFQNCTFLVRKPQNGQQNVITASKRSDHKEPTGIVIHGGQILPAPELAPVKGQFPVYLGRPWGSLSTAVIMETYIDDMVHPEGWTSWESSSGTQTCTYLEFKNRGPGASTNNRVKWPGVKILSENDAAKYLPPKFFAIGDDWIKETGIPYTATFDVSNEAEGEKAGVDLEKQKLGQQLEKQKEKYEKEQKKEEKKKNKDMKKQKNKNKHKHKNKNKAIKNDA
ncbi:probable pectinesterase/pectinesterase inhibitor 21 isoform X2 [Hibiscus syriacus]|uniref:probable pectinesterase/pectinesterase inhibitor 21 isoform X2 n=1 Tax=Hibiscus syriacus TaxID=106335 RepID=UPI001924E95A|nr:probable pectinesterase/pectinesterase inhibitor 21 isoform X2 [Hibiscus syriacus]